MAEISIIIRAKNEEKWIGHCLAAIQAQSYKDYEVVLVDNQSTDQTIEIARRFGVQKVIAIDQFLPGLAINDGIRASSGKFIVCLSAHCIPKSNRWLENLKNNFGDESIAGVYGKQTPVSFTNPADIRDLLIVFGDDKRVQIKDYFFHNANSMIRRDVWDQFPFDESVTNIEDRVWGKSVISAGFKLVYEPEAVVFHHHGLHQGNTRERLEGVVSILKKVDESVLGELPATMQPQALKVFAIIPISRSIKINSIEFDLLEKAISHLKRSKYIHKIVVIARPFNFQLEREVIFLDRDAIPEADEMSLDKLMSIGLSSLEVMGFSPDGLIYVNHEYQARPEEIFDELVWDAAYKGLDTVFPGELDYGHYWYQNSEGKYVQNDVSLETRSRRKPTFKALYGLGCYCSPSVLRGGEMIGGRIGILQVSNRDYEERLNIINV